MSALTLDPAAWRRVILGPEAPRWRPAPDSSDLLACAVAEEVGRVRARQAICAAVAALHQSGCSAICREQVCDLAEWVLGVDGRIAPRPYLRRCATARMRKLWGAKP